MKLSMNFATITRWEFKNTLKSKKFLLIFFMQLSVLAMLIIMFNSFAANIESDKGLSLTPSLTDFTTLDVDDQGGIFKKAINPEIIDIYSTNNNNSLIRIETGQTSGLYTVSMDSIERIQKGEVVDTVLYLDYADPRRSVVRDEINTTTQSVSTALTQSYLQSVNSQNTTQTGVKEEITGESLPLQLIRKVMLAVLLFMPLFLFGNIIIDSVVGEKERKTGEILVAMPLSHVEILLGKGLAVVAISALQVAMWIIILLAAGFTIKNVIPVYFLVVFTAIPIVGLTSIIAAYAKNYKEAGIGISIAYIVVVGFLIVPALAYISRKSYSANISPMTTVMRLFSGETITIPEILMSVMFIIIMSVLSFWMAAWLFRRDDILFGPRPGPIKLVLQLMGIKKR
ncbi:ABC transporter permease [Methanobacterium ferruginis]|uniref:ABC transporter permease n=1 Tax=Methanobacterium ferruginis TaxID=710191 RepID=UPI002572FA42|nr:ABC transporter permease [Methanobacterium ferruginis]BDZ67193.1 ABC transporter permease [Methanobacterium ferruginis]